VKIRTALRLLVDKYDLPMKLTPSQSVVLMDIKPTDKGDIVSILKEHGILLENEIDPMSRNSIACPAFPLCGLAMTEAERRMPDAIIQMRKLFSNEGLEDIAPIMRMTGCPNVCARPYMAEIAWVGSGQEQYQLWLGGSPGQTRVGMPILDKVKWDKMDETLTPIIQLFKSEMQPAEAFGDWAHRSGKDNIVAAVEAAAKAAAEKKAAEQAAAKADENQKAVKVEPKVVAKKEKVAEKVDLEKPAAETTAEVVTGVSPSLALLDDQLFKSLDVVASKIAEANSELAAADDLKSCKETLEVLRNCAEAIQAIKGAL